MILEQAWLFRGLVSICIMLGVIIYKYIQILLLIIFRSYSWYRYVILGNSTWSLSFSNNRGVNISISLICLWSSLVRNVLNFFFLLINCDQLFILIIWLYLKIQIASLSWLILLSLNCTTLISMLELIIKYKGTW